MKNTQSAEKSSKKHTKKSKEHPWGDRELITNPYYFTIVVTEKQFHKQMKRNGIRKVNRPDWVAYKGGGTLHHLKRKERNIGIIAIDCVDKWSSDPAGIQGLMVHELTHLWQLIRDFYKEKPSMEFEAYAMQGLYHEGLRLLTSAYENRNSH